MNPIIKMKSKLDNREYKDIKQLQNYCVAKDHVTLKLELGYKQSNTFDHSDNLDQINEFMCYDKDSLVGYIGICQFGGDILEVNGMVHPAHRRRGIFSQLFSLVKDEWHKRSSQDMLLLSDHNALSGLAFIKHADACYDHSEYEMFLKGEPGNGFVLNRLSLRKANNGDAKEIARQNAVYFHTDLERVDLTLPEEEEKRGIDIYIAEFENKIVGKVHLEVNDGVGGIYGLGVLPQYRRKGYGKGILMHAVALFQEKRANEIMLQVAVKNKHALKLYQSCGFETTSTMDYYKLRK